MLAKWHSAESYATEISVVVFGWHVTPNAEPSVTRDASVYFGALREVRLRGVVVFVVGG